MYCRNCGKEIPPQAVVCVSCGVEPGKGNKFCPYCGAETSPEAEVCIKCGGSLKKTIPPEEAKSKLVAGLLGIFLGGLGIHRFYLGYIPIGVVQLILALLGYVTCGITSIIAWVWGIIEGILILTGKSITTDAKGIPLKD